jgi:flagellar protein FlaJ
MITQNIIEKYQRWLEFDRMKVNAVTWISISIVASLAVGIVSMLVSSLIIKETTLLPLAFATASLVLLLGYPYMKKESIVDTIESNFSDALKQMADTLKAGDTYESALREVANSEYGRLSEEMESSLRNLEEGSNIENSLQGFSERVDSRLIQRTITIILDSIKTGASLAEILDEISEDVRDFHRLKEERKANTTMQFMFMIAAGGAIAPMIFGEVSAVMGIFTTITLSAIKSAQIATAEKSMQIILLLIQGYIIIEVVGSGVMMSIIREGKLNKSVIYIPLLLLLAFLMYYASTMIVGSMLAGAV